MNTNALKTEDQTQADMDRMYRWTRHVYDLSRKYYLLGRDHLIRNLKPRMADKVCEIGCGTARNLIQMARTYKGANFYGLDASEEMLKTARKSVLKSGLKIKLAQGYAQSFDPQELFGLESPLDKIVFSYALSIIPPWRESIDHALMLLPSGGEMHIVDFGDQEDLPKRFKAFLFWWLSKFHVYHKPEILKYLQKLDKEQYGTLKLTKLYSGYAYHAIFTKA